MFEKCFFQYNFSKERFFSFLEVCRWLDLTIVQQQVLFLKKKIKKKEIKKVYLHSRSSHISFVSFMTVVTIKASLTWRSIFASITFYTLQKNKILLIKNVTELKDFRTNQTYHLLFSRIKTETKTS